MNNPSAFLAEMHTISLALLAVPDMDPEAQRLAAMVIRLDGHLSTGGELPRRWGVDREREQEREPKMFCPGCRTMRPVSEIVDGDGEICRRCVADAEVLAEVGASALTTKKEQA